MTDIKTVWQRIEVWLEQNAPEVAAGMGGGATADHIAATEQALGVQFPEDVRASYRLHDGQTDDGTLGVAVGGGFTEGGDFLSLAGIFDQWKIWKDLLDSGDFDGSESEPEAGIRSDWWNAKWIPITHDGSGNHLCLDLDPAPGGKMGQIITMWHDEQSRSVVAGSLTDWLTQLADGYKNDEWMYSDEYGAVVRIEDVSE